LSEHALNTLMLYWLAKYFISPVYITSVHLFLTRFIRYTKASPNIIAVSVLTNILSSPALKAMKTA